MLWIWVSGYVGVVWGETLLRIYCIFKYLFSIKTIACATVSFGSHQKRGYRGASSTVCQTHGPEHMQRVKLTMWLRKSDFLKFNSISTYDTEQENTSLHYFLVLGYIFYYWIISKQFYKALRFFYNLYKFIPEFLNSTKQGW